MLADAAPEVKGRKLLLRGEDLDPEQAWDPVCLEGQ